MLSNAIFNENITALIGHFQVDYKNKNFSSNLNLSRASQVFQPEILIYSIEADFAYSTNLEYKIDYKGLGFSAFIHNLSNIPVSTMTYGFSAMDNLDILPLDYDGDLVFIRPEGKADIYGVSLSYSGSIAGVQVFSNLTLTDSKHELATGEITKAPLDYGYVYNLNLAKNWKIGLEAAKRTVEATTQLAVRDFSSTTGTRRLKPRHWLLEQKKYWTQANQGSSLFIPPVLKQPYRWCAE